MKIQALSIIAGNGVCNARCPFCISKMTGNDVQISPINEINFSKACRLAQINGVTNVLVTGKGEPTLFPDQISNFLELLQPHQFPIIELQTNGTVINNNFDKYLPHLEKWRELGLTIVSVSIVHYEAEKNRQIYLPYLKTYPDLQLLVSRLHQLGFSVRFSVTLIKGGLDTIEQVDTMIKKSKEWGVEQLTLRKVATPEKSMDDVAFVWTKTHQISQKTLNKIERYLFDHGHKIAEFNYGGSVFDIFGQNVCLTNCLTLDNNSSDFRQAIYYPDGHLRFDWQYNGAIIF